MIKDLPKTNEDTVVGENVRVTGKLHTSSNIQINGFVEGEVSSEGTIIIGRMASIKGPISARDIKIQGRIDGNIIASGQLELESGAKVFGDIETKSLAVSAGAVFNGKSIMAQEKEIKKEEKQEKEKEEEPKPKPVFASKMVSSSEDSHLKSVKWESPSSEPAEKDKKEVKPEVEIE